MPGLNSPFARPDLPWDLRSARDAAVALVRQIQTTAEELPRHLQPGAKRSRTTKWIAEVVETLDRLIAEAEQALGPVR